MDLKTYDHIKTYCYKKLVSRLHDRHFEDLVQYVAMKHFETNGKKSWEYSVYDYCRENGISSKKPKVCARALENSLSIDWPSGESEDSYFLIDQESILRSDHEDQRINHDDIKRGILEEFLMPLSLNRKVLEWTINHFKVKQS